MTVLNRTPENTSLLQPTKFLLTFDRIGSVQFFCQSVNLPGLNLGQAMINSPGLDYFAPGNKITYNPLNIRFLVDGELNTWKTLHSWFRAIASPEGTSERNTLQELQNYRKSGSLQSYSDATLTVLSALNNPILRVQFINIFPTSLSDITFDSTLSSEDLVIGDASFMFQHYNFLPLN